jgi:hypothetical protein
LSEERRIVKTLLVLSNKTLTSLEILPLLTDEVMIKIEATLNNKPVLAQY